MTTKAGLDSPRNILLAFFSWPSDGLFGRRSGETRTPEKIVCAIALLIQIFLVVWGVLFALSLIGWSLWPIGAGGSTGLILLGLSVFIYLCLSVAAILMAIGSADEETEEY